jgi:hypothetical protein
VTAVDGREFDVECKRAGTDFAELVKTGEAAAIADGIRAALLNKNLAGSVSISLGEYEWGNAQKTLGLLAPLLSDVKPGLQSAQLDRGTDVSLDLHELDGYSLPMTKLEDLRSQPSGKEYILAAAKRNGDRAEQPFVLRLRCPRYRSDRVFKKVEDALIDAADRQLRPNFPGAIAMQFSGISNADEFRELDWLEPITSKVFDRPHVVAITFVGRPLISREAYGHSAHTYGLLLRNDRSRFPNIVALQSILEEPKVA